MKRTILALLANILLLLIYFAAAKAGLSLARVNAAATAVWPPTGIALAALLLLGYRAAPAVLLGALWANYTIEHDWAAAAGIAVGNLLEALVGAALVRNFAAGSRFFERAADVLRYVFYAAMLSTAVSASIGTTALSLRGLANWNDYASIWLTWWLGDSVSALVIAPMLVVWLTNRPRWRLASMIEATALLLATLAIGWVVFGPVFAARTPVGYLSILPLLWAAMRFHQRGAASVVFITSAIAISGTLNGRGPFALPDENAALLFMQAFLGTISVMGLLLSAVVAERRQTQLLAQDWEQRFLQMAENIREVFYVNDLRPPRMQYVSPGYEQIWGRTCQSLYDDPRSWLEAVHPEDRPKVIAATEKFLTGEEPEREYRIMRPDGSVRWIWDRAAAIRNEAGEVYRMTGIAEDVTARKQLEDQQSRALERERAARQEAELASRAKDNFLAVLSHELRTPLTPVLLITSLLQRQDDLPAEVKEHLQTIRHNVELEARLIDDLLDLTRVARGKLQLNFEVVDLHTIAMRSLEICRRADRASIELDLSAAEHHVHADPARLQQVFCNLLNNAQKFTAADGTIRLRTYNPRADWLRIEVQDNGMGIDPQMLPRLFNAFEQVEGSGARRLGGLGLGLAISKSLVQAHGGSLSAASAGRGHGATFLIELRCVAPASFAADGGSGRAHDAVSRRSLSVLLVEDHVPTQRAMAKLLQNMGHTISAAGDVKSALSHAESTRFDLVISDLGLPDGSGHDLMRTIRQRYGISGIALSGYGMEHDIKRSREAGFTEHLTKPVTLEALEAVVARVAQPRGD